MFLLTLLFSLSALAQKSSVLVGLENWDQYSHLVNGKRIAVACNQSSIVSNGTHLLNFFQAKNLTIKKIFALEHGIRGTAEDGKTIEDGVDPATGAKIISLYGKKREPSAEDLKDVDLIVYDIQDVGVRTYTFISSLVNILRVAAREGKEVLILDRPNPNGDYIAGPTLQKGQESFVGALPIPLVYGLTPAELAQFVWQDLKSKEGFRLRISPLRNYTHETTYEPPVPPSPNLPNYEAVRLYPSLVLFEATKMSVGRGTPFPFQVVGYPDPKYGNFTFTPERKAGSENAPLLGQKCFGLDLRGQKFRFSPAILFQMARKNPSGFLTDPNFFLKLSGDPLLADEVLGGATYLESQKRWKRDIDSFREKSASSLLYPRENGPLIKNALERARNESLSPGGVLVAGSRTGKRIEQAFGNFRYEKSPQMKADSIFDLASLTKIFTATSILILHQEGRLKISDHAGAYLPSFSRGLKAEITIEQLLRHTSGLPAANADRDYDPANPEKNWRTVLALEPAKNPDTGKPYEAGETYIYSDIGYMILGKIVEATSGMSLAEFEKQKIFTPLGMQDTGFRPTANERIVPTSSLAAGIVHDERARYLGGVAGHAGLFSTTLDLEKFAREFLVEGNGKILSKEVRELMSSGSKRALGWDLDSPHSVPVKAAYFDSPSALNHTGFTGTSLLIDRKSQSYLILLTNRVFPKTAAAGGSPLTMAQFRRWITNLVAQALNL